MKVLAEADAKVGSTCAAARKRGHRVASAVCGELPGGAEGNRTPDLIIANDALYQLSYGPKEGAE